MVNLRDLVYYEEIEDEVVELFERFQWPLARLGVVFTEEVGEAMVYCSQDLESSLNAFCGWMLWQREQGQRFTPDMVNQILIQAIKDRWVPTPFQQRILKQYRDWFKPYREFLWDRIIALLGADLAAYCIADVTPEGQIQFRENLQLSTEAQHKVKTLKRAMVTAL